TVTTDAQGNAEVTFQAAQTPAEQAAVEEIVTRSNADGSVTAEAVPIPTPELPAPLYNRPNPLYAIEAEVTDQSRRTVEAQGEVKVSNQQYFAFLDAKQGYYQQGDRIPIEVRTQDANDKAFAASGKMVVYKL